MPPKSSYDDNEFETLLNNDTSKTTTDASSGTSLTLPISPSSYPTTTSLSTMFANRFSNNNSKTRFPVPNQQQQQQLLSPQSHQDTANDDINNFYDDDDDETDSISLSPLSETSPLTSFSMSVEPIHYEFNTRDVYTDNGNKLDIENGAEYPIVPSLMHDDDPANRSTKSDTDSDDEYNALIKRIDNSTGTIDTPRRNDGSSSKGSERRIPLVHSSSTSNSAASIVPGSKLLQLLFGASGIYSSYLLYGHYQEDLFLYRSSSVMIDGQSVSSLFHYVWFLQAIESFAIIIFGTVALIVMNYWESKKNRFGENKGVFGSIQALPKRPFLQSGASQVLSKTFTSLALSAGLSYPVCTITKSAKLVPVMIGQLLLGGGKSYALRDYAFAFLLVAGTALLSMQGGGGVNHHGSTDEKGTSSGVVGPVTSIAGLLWIGSSLFMDGLTAGLQKRIRSATVQCPPTTFDFLLLTNISMGAIAFIVSIVLPSQATIVTTMNNGTGGAEYSTISTNDFMGGYYFLQQNPLCLRMVIILCSCSVIGQSFIFYIIAQFDPFVCSTITTTRKVLSVLWSIVMKGHVLSYYGKIGILCAISGMILEIHGKATTCNSNDTTSKRTTNMNVNSFGHVCDKKRPTNTSDDYYHQHQNSSILQQYPSKQQIHTTNNNTTNKKNSSLWGTFLQSTILRPPDVVNDTHHRNNSTTTTTSAKSKSQSFLTKRLLTNKSDK